MNNKSSIVCHVAAALALCLPSARGWQPEAGNRWIEILLDASASMNLPMSSGSSRLAVAGAAVRAVLGGRPRSEIVALRAYGHQAPAAQLDCSDTRLLNPFAALGMPREALVDSLENLRASGVSPLTQALEEAAADFKNEPGFERVLIVMTDGRDNCPGDPCVKARELARADDRLVIHTVALGVGESARQPLDCIARAAGGRYFSAMDQDQLRRVLTEAMGAGRGRASLYAGSGSGELHVAGAGARLEVLLAYNGSTVRHVNRWGEPVRLSAGIYQVRLGDGIWKGVEVIEGETTLLQPGFLRVENAGVRGHPILDAETVLANSWVTSDGFGGGKAGPLVPGDYRVMFDEMPWPVFVAGGEPVVLRPGILRVEPASILGHRILWRDGPVSFVAATLNWKPLPPGEYRVEMDGRQVPVTLEEGKTVSLQPARSETLSSLPEIQPRWKKEFPARLQRAAFSPDGEFIAVSTAEEVVVLDAGGAIRWRVVPRRVSPYLVAPATELDTRPLAVAPGGEWLLLAGDSSYRYVWKVSKDGSRWHFRTYGTPSSIAVSRTAGRIAVGTASGRIHFLSPAGELAQEVDNKPWIVEDIAFAADGDTLILQASFGVGLLAADGEFKWQRDSRWRQIRPSRDMRWFSALDYANHGPPGGQVGLLSMDGTTVWQRSLWYAQSVMDPQGRFVVVSGFPITNQPWTQEPGPAPVSVIDRQGKTLVERLLPDHSLLLVSEDGASIVMLLRDRQAISSHVIGFDTQLLPRWRIAEAPWYAMRIVHHQGRALLLFVGNTMSAYRIPQLEQAR